MQPDIQVLITEYAQAYNLKEDRFRAVIKCESSFNPKAVGDNGTSFGLVQIHLPAHPHVTKEQAFNPEFALRFMAEAWANDDAWMWTCWRNMYGGKSLDT